mgnify:CR=1 FL=1
MKITLTLKDFLDIQSTYLIQIRQRTACYVLKILTTLEQQYQTPPTSTVLIMGDTSSTTTKGLILRILLGTTHMLLMNYVNWRYMVSNCFAKPKNRHEFFIFNENLICLTVRLLGRAQKIYSNLFELKT